MRAGLADGENVVTRLETPCAASVELAAQNLEWWAQPWPCGHDDPVYVDDVTQRCALCHHVRQDPDVATIDTEAAALEANARTF